MGRTVVLRRRSILSASKALRARREPVRVVLGKTAAPWRGLWDEGWRLCAALCDEDERLQVPVARAAPYSSGPCAGGGRAACACEPGRPGRVGRTGIGPARCIGAGYRPGALGALLGLTPVESHVAASLVEGKSALDIAAETGRGVTAAKSHIRQIFAKRKLSGQADPVRLAMSLADAPGLRR